MKAWCVGVSLLAAMGSACAQWYAGGSLGSGDVDAACCSSSGTGLKFYGGFELGHKAMPNLAIEAGYIDFGEASGSGLLSSASVGATALTVAGAIRLKFTPMLSGVGRLGFANVEGTASASVPGLGVSRSESNVKLYYGLGLEYSFSPQWKATGSLDFSEYEIGNQTGNVSLMGVGVQYAF
jgi:OOP family OmpA-OmpF porin